MSPARSAARSSALNSCPASSSSVMLSRVACCWARAVKSLLSGYDVLGLIGRSAEVERPDSRPMRSWVHPHGRAARDPLRHGLVGERLALPAGNVPEQRNPVPDLLASVP